MANLYSFILTQQLIHLSCITLTHFISKFKKMGNQNPKQEMLRPQSTVAKPDKGEYVRYCRAPLHPSPKVFVALCDHQPRSYDEISLEKGEEMEVLSTARSSDVVLVRLLNGSKHGFVPFECIAEKGSYRAQE